MSIPGLGADEPEEEIIKTGVQTEQVKVIDLHKEQEWRFEVALGKRIEVKVTAGTAELHGTDLAPSKPYTFIGVKSSIYTWTGCTLTVTLSEGPSVLSSEYIASETTLHESLNIHLALDSLRADPNSSAPRVLILGPENVGKTTLARTLIGYAVRSGRSPCVVNLDPSEGLLSIPGTLSATVFKTILEVEADEGGGWGTSPMSGPNGEVPVKLPLVYYFGGVGIEEKRGASIYKALVGRLGLAVQGRIGMDAEVQRTGIIVDTPGSLLSVAQAATGYELVAHVVGEFSINAVICVGTERVYNDMVRKFDGQPITGAARAGAGEVIQVIKLPKSGGVVDRDATHMKAVMETQIKTYFYGNPKVGASISLQPRMQQVDFDALPTVWRRLSSNALSYASQTGGTYDDDNFLPGGLDDSEYAPPESTTTISIVPLPDSQLFEKITRPIHELRNCILAVMNCAPDPDEPQEILRDSSCMGFLYVTDVDPDKGRVSLLSPVAGRVPNRALVWSEEMQGVMGIVT